MPQIAHAAKRSPHSHDALTHAMARPNFVAAVREHARSSQRSGNVFCLLLADVDRLRNVNDSRGIAAGDKVLVAVADRLRRVLKRPAWHRSEYTLARYDGGAFMVLARPCAVHHGEMLAEALRFGVAEGPLVQRLNVTVSVSVAQYRIGESVDDLFARTELALHLAKQFGRDRVEVSPTPPSHVERAKVVGLFD